MKKRTRSLPRSLLRNLRRKSRSKSSRTPKTRSAKSGYPYDHVNEPPIPQFSFGGFRKKFK